MVYVATPHNAHLACALLAIGAGKSGSRPVIASPLYTTILANTPTTATIGGTAGSIVIDGPFLLQR